MVIKCACGDEFKTKKMFVLHILTLGCFDEDLVFKDANLGSGEEK